MDRKAEKSPVMVCYYELTSDHGKRRMEVHLPVSLIQVQYAVTDTPKSVQYTVKVIDPGPA